MFAFNRDMSLVFIGRQKYANITKNRGLSLSLSEADDPLSTSKSRCVPGA